MSPMRALRPCKHPGCSALVGIGYCDKHTKDAHEYDKYRGSSTERGYSSRWRRYRILFIREHPLCRECQAEGKLTPTFAIDHIIPHRGDYELFWDEDNHQPLCEHHHNSKTRRGE